MKSIAGIFIIALSFGLQAQSVKIAAAADLRYAMTEIVKAYQLNNPKATIDVVYGSSGNAYTQISSGAPFDVFFSADIVYPKKLKEEGFALTEPKLYGIGRIVLWSSTLDVSKGLKVLTENSNSRIAIANPEHAPYGERSVAALKYYKIYPIVSKQLIFGDNISQAAQFCLTGNADAGLLALSLVLSPSMTSQGHYYLIEEKSHSPLKQAYVILKHAKGNSEVRNFVNFMATKTARTIFEKYGFALPK